MTKTWQVENVGVGWAIYMVDENTEYVDEHGDNLIFDTKNEAQHLVNLLNKGEQ
jgi:hypothetical protein